MKREIICIEQESKRMRGGNCRRPRADPSFSSLTSVHFSLPSVFLQTTSSERRTLVHCMMAQTALGRMTIPAAIGLIAFLAYGSQILFYYIEPSPLDRQNTLIFNILVASIWITYARTCLTNVGWVPTGWTPELYDKTGDNQTPRRTRWCRKCEAPKPARAHHCKTCSKCVPKMDHHCPWTASCVSHRTFPHFFRFLIYSVISMCYLAYFLYIRGSVLWEHRNLPSVRKQP